MGVAYLCLVVLGSRGIRHLHSIFDFLAIHFSVLVEHDRGCQRRMTFAVCRFANPVSDKISQTPYMTAEDINIGWGAIIETFEMRLVGLRAS